MGGDVFERRGKRRRRQPSPPRPYHFAAEAEPAIDRADVDDFQEHAVGVTMDHPLDGTERIVGDRIGALFRAPVEFTPIGHELPRDRIVRIAAIDGVGHRRRDGDGVARSHFGEFAKPLTRHQGVLAKLVDGL